LFLQEFELIHDIKMANWPPRGAAICSLFTSQTGAFVLKLWNGFGQNAGQNKDLRRGFYPSQVDNGLI